MADGTGTKPVDVVRRAISDLQAAQQGLLDEAQRHAEALQTEIDTLTRIADGIQPATAAPAPAAPAA